jgi:hypothetical protein
LHSRYGWNEIPTRIGAGPFGYIGKDTTMSNRSAFILAVIIVLLIVLDVTVDGSRVMTFLLRKLVDAIDYVEFWR